jgi:hypothetical protein
MVSLGTTNSTLHNSAHAPLLLSLLLLRRQAH